MPSGYTQPLHDGETITFAQFALRCSRGMGAAIMQRDESPDTEIRLREVSDYETQRVVKARADLEAALTVTDDEWAQKQKDEIAEATAYRDKYITDRTALSGRYWAMQKQVHDWTPPTDEHEGLKKFMLDQLRDSIAFDVGRPGETPYTPNVPEEVPAYEYKARQIARLSRGLADATEQLSKELDRVRSQNEWVTALRDSLTEHEGKTR